jgi:hypothetical protein
MPPAEVLRPMSSRRLALGLILVALMPGLAGCNFKDFYNQEGLITIQLAPTKTAINSSLNDFREVRIAVYGVTIRQIQSIDPKSFSYPVSDPLLLDLVAKAGERVPLTQFRTNLRATQSVTVRLDVVEAIDAAGRNMKVCHEGEKLANTDYPCFFVPEQLSYTYNNHSFSPPRGGEVVVAFPLVVKWQEQAGKREYFLDSPAEITVFEQHR